MIYIYVDMFDGAKVRKIGEICKKNDNYFINDKNDFINDNFDNLDNIYGATNMSP